MSSLVADIFADVCTGHAPLIRSWHMARHYKRVLFIDWVSHFDWLTDWSLQHRLTDMRQRLQATADAQSKLIKARNELRPIAVHASMLYSLLSTMPAVNHMYQTSLQQFVQILQLSLHKFVVTCLLVTLTKRRRTIIVNIAFRIVRCERNNQQLLYI